MCTYGTTALGSGSTQLWVQLNPSLEVLLVHTKDQVMHSYMSPPISAVSQVYILPRFLLVQVWSMNFRILRLRNTQKQKKCWTNFRWFDRFIRSNKNLECTFVLFCIFYLFYLNFSIKMALSSFFDIFETWKYSWIFVLNL